MLLKSNNFFSGFDRANLMSSFHGYIYLIYYVDSQYVYIDMQLGYVNVLVDFYNCQKVYGKNYLLTSI